MSLNVSLMRQATSLGRRSFRERKKERIFGFFPSICFSSSCSSSDDEKREFISTASRWDEMKVDVLKGCVASR
jgi:hypothetical protein